MYHTKCSIALNAAKVQNIQWQTQLFENRDRLLSLEAGGVQKQSHLWELTIQYNTIQYKICKAPCCRGFRDEAVANRRLGLKPAVKQFCYLIVNVTSNSSRFSHTHLTVPFLGLCRWAGTTKVKPIWILLKHETVSGSGISWAVCKSAPRSRQTTTPPLSFLQVGCPSCRPNNSVKALKTNSRF